ncbi:head-tail joining protein [Bordetella bronchialis]|uniref:Phage tail protein n=1 Tax=Bordetella bronchialis TaxID=463025 RepID=A0A193FUQ3_9BORD|nr:hypothetical protein [Bordetella bronchialis]ANN70911.1 hypothetical protein BAU08_05815 [Bordetella bronchialis]
MVDFDQVNVAINGAFGEDLVYQPAAGGPPKPITGVFTDAYKMPFQNGEGGIGWTTTAPSVGVRLADLPAAPAKDDRITRVKTGNTYLVFDQKPNGIGWVHIELKKAS